MSAFNSAKQLANRLETLPDSQRAQIEGQIAMHEQRNAVQAVRDDIIETIRESCLTFDDLVSIENHIEQVITQARRAKRINDLVRRLNEMPDEKLNQVSGFVSDLDLPEIKDYIERFLERETAKASR